MLSSKRNFAILLTCGFLFAFLGESPASALTYDYNVNFQIGSNTVTGTIVTDCDSCLLSFPQSSTNVVSWSFYLNGTDHISSSDTGAMVQGLNTSPLLATPAGIEYTYSSAVTANAFTFCDNSLCVKSFLDFNTGALDQIGYAFYDLANNSSVYPRDQATGSFSLTPTPLPAALPLFAGGLGALGLFGGRRKRKNAAAIVV